MNYRQYGRRLQEAQDNINKAFHVLCEELPDGWEIRFVARFDEAELELYDPDGNCVSEQWDGDSHDLWYLVDYAKAGALL